MSSKVGLKFPMQLVGGRWATVGGVGKSAPTVNDLDVAAQTSALMIIRSGDCERVMNCSFGLAPEKYLYSTLGTALTGFINRELREQCAAFSTRVTVSASNVQMDTTAGTMRIDLTLKHAGIQQESALKVEVIPND